ncbi:hypothetical protein P8879_02115 [Bacillus spizizenii]|nr:hypothetical protein JN25_19465 [Bacillus sp. BSC154]MCY7829977.1 hypothetical protein [Bacillus spizizenii]MCY7842897.1 hypothetical protein [Bacillus spizizenii]MCY9315793.1 hypothetical protein [Bacillus spizizenii]MEC0560529.1 hypothetical protein [Bacillus spizizenii]
MKKLIVLTLVCFGLISGFNVQSADAKITTESTKVSFTMTEETKGFSMADYNNWHYHPTELWYKFTIFDAEGCTLKMTIYRITLGGWEFPRSVKEFTGNHFDFSATDRVEGDPYKNHSLMIEKNAGCGDVKIKGKYGIDHDEPDDYPF